MQHPALKASPMSPIAEGMNQRLRPVAGSNSGAYRLFQHFRHPRLPRIRLVLLLVPPLRAGIIRKHASSQTRQ